MTSQQTRRSFLAAAGVGVLGVGAAWQAGGQENLAEIYRLRMTNDGFVGNEPEAIAEEASPRLELSAGQRYGVVVENESDQAHNLVMTDAYPGGIAMFRTNVVDPGGAQGVTFTARPSLTAYYCEQHSHEVGPVAVQGAAGTQTGNVTAVNATGPRGDVNNTTATPTPRPPVNVTERPGTPAVNESVLPENRTGNATGENIANPTARFTDISGVQNASENQTGNATGNVTGNATGDLAGASPDPAKTFRFVGSVPAWVAQAPQEIQGQENPELPVEPGETYEIVWVNADGAPHNWFIETEDDESLVRSDTIQQAGSWQTVKFVASENMYQYYCQYHPVAMRGDLNLGGT
ncbi:plastocyanin/azurin family copper-binding protein [Halorientalis brevis]|uniref:Plastocyanin/azurin family copper-binding protein n=1 Tax=Halorientalis brevis TaxID=1126241 RepID=A0ABD6CGN3_9EURY|nr:plastocyanin/azurin family copper-binding protein [Halorientalis brevis]